MDERTVNNRTQPMISVIMSVYNVPEETVFKAAVDSIKNQIFTNFEFLIYNDGSDKTTTELLRKIAKTDPRIMLIESEINRGLSYALNQCIKKAKGKYLARMDADDISKPQRFMEQYTFLEGHKEYDWCGTGCELIDDEGVWGIRQYSENPGEKEYMNFSPFIHPSVMFRASIFQKEEAYCVSKITSRCEDYELFLRLYSKGYRGYNIQRILFCYREDPSAYRKRRFRYRINEAILRYRKFKDMKLLFPKGWFYVLRPIAAYFVPMRLIRWIKREKLEFRDE